MTIYVKIPCKTTLRPTYFYIPLYKITGFLSGADVQFLDLNGALPSVVMEAVSGRCQYIGKRKIHGTILCYKKDSFSALAKLVTCKCEMK
jgi:hypothetical protein